MITYPFLCESCNETIEIKKSIREETPSAPGCPSCGGLMHRVYRFVPFSIPRGRCGNANNGYNDEITDIINGTE